MPEFALVKLNKKYESGLSTDREKYAMNSCGTLIDVNVKPTGIHDGKPYGTYHNCISKTVYFTPFEDGDIIKLDGEEFVFVPVKQIRGVKQ